MGRFVQWEKYKGIAYRKFKVCVKIKERFQSAQEELDAGYLSCEYRESLITGPGLPKRDKLFKRSVSHGSY